MSRVFTNSLGDQGSIQGRVMSMTQNLMPPCLTLNIIRHGSGIK